MDPLPVFPDEAMLLPEVVTGFVISPIFPAVAIDAAYPPALLSAKEEAPPYPAVLLPLLEALVLCNCLPSISWIFSSKPIS